MTVIRIGPLNTLAILTLTDDHDNTSVIHLQVPTRIHASPPGFHFKLILGQSFITKPTPSLPGIRGQMTESRGHDKLASISPVTHRVKTGKKTAFLCIKECTVFFPWTDRQTDRQTPLFIYKAQGSPFRS